MNAIRAVWRAVRQLDNRDIHVYGGLGIAAVGGCMLSTPWTCIAVGSVLIAFGLFGALLDAMVAHMTVNRGHLDDD